MEKESVFQIGRDWVDLENTIGLVTTNKPQLKLMVMNLNRNKSA